MSEFIIDDVKFNYNIDMIHSNELQIISNKKNYSVHYCDIGYDIITKLYNPNDIIFIDTNVHNIIFNTNNSFFNNMNVYKFHAIEQNKNIDSVIKFIDYMMECNFTKTNKIIVVGGGITQEVGGFSAAIYKRGITWVYIPTTILAMTDSCIGSKVSLNHISKNILGLMEAPNKIYISECFINTLNNDDIVSGIGEAFKLSLIGGTDIYNIFLDKLVNKNYIDMIKIASIIKKEIIEYDEFEIHHRKSLNYGHTIGHALEAVTCYHIPHGIGVIFGMIIKNKFILKHDEINKILLNLIPLKYFDITFNYNEFFKHILNDKKNKGDMICMIILENIGHTIITYKHKDDIFNNLYDIMKNIFKNMIM